jgi:hypothetical protein
VVRLALEKMEAGKPVETLHLTDVVLASDQNNQAALGARLKALQYLRDHAENYVEAGYLDYGIRTTKEIPASK